jgi:flagellar biosynthetic protein FlhB
MLVEHVGQSLAAAPTATREQVSAALERSGGVVLRAVLPVLLAAAGAAAVVAFLQAGALLSWKRLAPDLARLDPVAGLRRMLSVERLLDLLRSVVGILTVLVVVGVTLADALADLVGPAVGSPLAVTQVAARWMWTLLWRGLAVLAVAAAVDYGIRWRRHRRSLMMTRAEVMREHRESEGDPRRKAERRRVHQEILQHAMLEQVGQADVVVVNPTHLAVALRYDRDRAGAPVVVAKGQALVAERIKRLAREGRVPIVHDVSLARSLMDLDLGAEIPEALYDAVAEVLRALEVAGDRP